MIVAASDVTSQSMGGRFELGTSFIKNSLWYFGADVYRVEKDGFRQRAVSTNPCNMMTFDPPKQFSDPIWQNSDWTNAGMFTELRYSFRPNVSLLVGGRGDFVTSINNEPAPQFLEKYRNLGKMREANFSASLSFNYDVNPTTSFKLVAGRGARSANITERYINHQNIGQDLYEYVGNPNLKPEINHQVEIALEKKMRRFSIAGNVFYANIQDYITSAVNPDINRVYLPCKEPKNARQFMNVSRATQTGFEINAGGQLTSYFTSYGFITYTRAQNHDWDEPLPEIPPLEGKLALRYNYHSGLFWLEADGRFASNQDRYAESFGESETPAFSVYNFFGGFRATYYLELQVGVQNILDKTYYEHLNRQYRNQPINSVVWEPGRNFIFVARLHY
jgi:iron complex outermembrane receptor protein